MTGNLGLTSVGATSRRRNGWWRRRLPRGGSRPLAGEMERGRGMAAKTATNTMPDTYFELVKQFPLARIRDEGHLDEAHEVIDRLLRKNLDDGEQVYLDALPDLVEPYEDKHEPMPDASEADVLRLLM